MSYFVQLVPILALLVGCTIEKPTSGDTQVPDDTDADEACEDDLECYDNEICEDGDCIDGDRDNSYSEATIIRQGEVGEGVIFPDQDVDYFVYTADDAQWVRIDTRVNVEDCSEEPSSADHDYETELDTVVTIRNTSGTIHAWADNTATGRFLGYDSVLFAYLPAAGDWYITVEDLSTFEQSGEGIKSGEDFFYCLEVKDFTGDTRETDDADNPSWEDTLDDNYIYIAGVLVDEPGDIDYLEVELQNPVALSIVGFEDLPGSDAVSRVSLFEPGGDLISTKDNVGPDGYQTYYDTEASTYLIEATDAFGGGGDDYWYVLFFQTFDSSGEVETEPNPLNNPMDVETTEKKTSSGSVYESAFIWGALKEEDDEDAFVIALEPKDYFSIRCSTDSSGSLASIAAEILDGSKQTIMTVTDGSDEAPDLENYQITTADDYYVRLYSEDGVYGIASYWSCGFFVTPFKASW
ncbi:MAG: hypothetical protein HN348_01340 [Proteobacteria bacterium]|nr:hypothetical protein [Pseudomonadota bacterium]